MDLNHHINKNYSIELLRFFAACGIVWFHVGADGAQFAYGGLPVFIIFTITFIINSSNSLKIQIQKSFKRLMYPWIFWSLIYGILKIVEVIITGSSIKSKFPYWMLLTGTSIHYTNLFLKMEFGL